MLFKAIISFKWLEKFCLEFHIAPNDTWIKEALCSSDSGLFRLNSILCEIYSVNLSVGYNKYNKMEFKSVAMILQQPVFGTSRRLIWFSNFTFVSPVLVSCTPLHLCIISSFFFFTTRLLKCFSFVTLDTEINSLSSIRHSVIV